MTDLIARLEAATGPDRELDARIWCVAHSVDFDTECPVRSDGKRHIDYRRVPRYTESVDSALESVPEGWYTTAACEDSAGRGWSWSLGNQAGVQVATPGWHPTPALAICIAIRRAMGEG